MRPESCEFSKETKIEALKRCDFTCERCGIKKKDTKEGYLEIHHKLGIAIACRHYPHLAHSLIASLANTSVLCVPCHDLMDKIDAKMHHRHAQALESQVRKNYKAPARL